MGIIASQKPAQRLLDAIGDRRLPVGRVRPAPEAVVQLMRGTELGPSEIADTLLQLLHDGLLVVDIDAGMTIVLRRPG